MAILKGSSDECAVFRLRFHSRGGRVEKIAEALAARLGRDHILYDRWHSAEFARPNLGMYLPHLYHNESDLIVPFLSSHYNEKEWCGLEWRAIYDLLKGKQDERLMLLRLDDAEIAGLYSIDGFLPINGMSDEDVAAAILKRLDMLDRARTTPTPAPPGLRTFTRTLPTVDSFLIGRESELKFLEDAWKDPETNVVQLIAPGGTGKTALVTKWYKEHVKDAHIFGWSFYSQGTQEKSQTSADPFFAEALPWFGLTVSPTATIYAKADALVEHLRSERVLLILDGIEPLQDTSGDLRDLALKALIQELAVRNAGMILITTRVKLSDIPDDRPSVLSLDLDNLDPADGARYLKHLGVVGEGAELRDASEAYGNHALAITLLGTCLVTFCQGDIRRRSDIGELQVMDTKPGKHARKVMGSYARMYEGQPELDILRALGYFNHPAEPAAFKLVRPGLERRKYHTALNRLHKARLLLFGGPCKAYRLSFSSSRAFLGMGAARGPRATLRALQKSGPITARHTGRNDTSFPCCLPWLSGWFSPSDAGGHRQKAYPR